MRDEALKRAKILVVDDHEPNVLLVEAILKRAGYTNVVSTTESGDAVELFHDSQPDLLVLDLHMPSPNGFEIMEQLASETPEGTFVPILVLTADVTPQAMHRALSMGARDFLHKPFDAVEVVLRIRNLLETQLLHQQLQDENALLESEVSKRTEELQRSLRRMTVMAEHRRVLLSRVTNADMRAAIDQPTAAG